MIDVRDRVFHPKYGKGKVIQTKEFGQLLNVDYFGVSRWHTKREFMKKNTYHNSAKDKFISFIDKQIEKAENEYSEQARQIAITVLNDLKLEL